MRHHHEVNVKWLPLFRTVLTVLFATMGYTASLVVAPLRQYPEIREMHVFFGPSKDPRHSQTLRTVQEVGETFGVKLHKHATKDGFDFDQALRAYVQTLDKVREGDLVLFNASGGPRPMIMAATIFCNTHDIPLLYYDEYDTKEGKQVPLKAYRSLRGLGDTKRALLQRLKDKGPTDVSGLASGLNLAMSTVSAHVRELLGKGLVSTERDGKRQVVALTPGIAVMDLEAIA